MNDQPVDFDEPQDDEKSLILASAKTAMLSDKSDPTVLTETEVKARLYDCSRLLANPMVLAEGEFSTIYQRFMDLEADLSRRNH